RACRLRSPVRPGADGVALRSRLRSRRDDEPRRRAARRRGGDARPPAGLASRAGGARPRPHRGAATAGKRAPAPPPRPPARAPAPRARICRVTPAGPTSGVGRRASVALRLVAIGVAVAGVAYRLASFGRYGFWNDEAWVAITTRVASPAEFWLAAGTTPLGW